MAHAGNRFWANQGSGALKKINDMGFPIEQVVVGVGGQTTIDFTSVPADYENLYIKLTGRGTNGTTTVAVQMRFNGDATASYNWARHFGGSSSGNVTTAGDTSFTCGYLAAGTADANHAGEIEISIKQYARTTFEKTFHSDASHFTSDATTTFVVNWFAGNWYNTAAVNQVTLLCGAGDFAEGTVATLYAEPK